MHKEPETWRPLSAHFLHPSARLQLGNPAWKKQSAWNRSRQMSKRVQRTYVSAEHVVCAANFDSVEPNWWYCVNAIKNQKNLFFGSFGAEQTVEIKLIIKETRRFVVSPQRWRDTKYCCIRPVIISDPPVGQIIEPEIRLLESEKAIP